MRHASRQPQKWKSNTSARLMLKVKTTRACVNASSMVVGLAMLYLLIMCRDLSTACELKP